MSPTKITDIKQQLASGQYRIDPYAVADAMIRRAEIEMETAGRRFPDFGAQTECSKPTSSCGASVKTALGRPSTTVPTKLRAAVVLGHAA
jgi:hypothetical protein